MSVDDEEAHGILMYSARAQGRDDYSGNALLVVTSWAPYSRPGNPEVRPWAASAARGSLREPRENPASATWC